MRIVIDAVDEEPGFIRIEVLDGEKLVHLNITERDAVSIYGLPLPVHEGQVFESETPGICVDVTQRERERAKNLYNSLLTRERRRG